MERFPVARIGFSTFGNLSTPNWQDLTNLTADGLDHISLLIIHPRTPQCDNIAQSHREWAVPLACFAAADVSGCGFLYELCVPRSRNIWVKASPCL